jgi:tetratricopeptide (TPR) repeat protein
MVAAQAMLGVAHHLRGNLAESLAILVAVRDAQLGASEVTNFYGFHRDAEVLIARTQWLQGFPDQAALTAANANRIDERRDPVTTCLGLMWGVSVPHLRGDWAVTNDYVDRMLTLASEHSLLPYKWFAMALRGDLQLQRGDTDAGISNLKEYSRRLTEGGYDINARWLTCRLAEGLANNQHAEQAWRLLNDFDADPDRRSDVYMPEFLRVRGVILAEAGEATSAAQALHASLEMADAQGALSWRLRTISSLARLRLKQGRLSEAREMLADTYGRFTEGFETLDLRTARTLITEIDARTGASTPT